MYKSLHSNCCSYFAALILVASLFYAISARSQVYDTISNWDRVSGDWNVLNATGGMVDNPDVEGINPSEKCFMISTSTSEWDLMYLDLDEPVDFTEFPVYHLKFLAPPTGGDVALKFQNDDNSNWIEYAKPVEPGQWQEIAFDFSANTSDNFVRMVIFFDFKGTTPDETWYVDDVVGVSTNFFGLTSNLPIVIINTDGQEIPDEPKISAHLGIINNGPGQINHHTDPFNDYDGMMGIEVRGQSSQYFYPKKSYSFETRDDEGENLNVSILGMPEENDWVLYAPYGDKSMLRNVVTYGMSRSMGDYCTRTVFCEVILNGNYMGVYVMMEKIKKDDNRVNIATLNPGEITGDDLTGGYIIRVDKTDGGFQMGRDGWVSVPSPPYPNAMNITFQYYYPKADDIVTQQKTYIQNFIFDAGSALTNSTYADPDNGYNKFLNTGSFVDHLLLNEISKEVDKYRYSTYFFKEKDSDGGKLFSGPAWDFNLGYSNVDYWPPGNDYSGWLYLMVEPVDWSIIFWWKRLMEDSYFRSLTKTRWFSLRQNELSNDRLSFVIDSITEYIGEAQVRNYERWPILGEYVWPNFDWENNTYEDEVANFESWLLNRVAWMDYNLPGTVINPTAELSGNDAVLQIKLFDDYFSRPVLKNKYFTLNNAPPDFDIDTVIVQDASTVKLFLSNNPKGNVDISVTMDAKILNSFDDLTTNVASIGITSPEDDADDLKLYASQGRVILDCKHPELLGTRLEIFNISGQLIQDVEIQKVPINYIYTQGQSGIYLYRFLYNGKRESGRILAL